MAKVLKRDIYYIGSVRFCLYVPVSICPLLTIRQEMMSLTRRHPPPPTKREPDLVWSKNELKDLGAGGFLLWCKQVCNNFSFYDLGIPSISSGIFSTPRRTIWYI